jgi:hypothetical protein
MFQNNGTTNHQIKIKGGIQIIMKINMVFYFFTGRRKRRKRRENKINV